MSPTYTDNSPFCRQNNCFDAPPLSGSVISWHVIYHEPQFPNALGVMSDSTFVPGVATDGGAETELHGVAWTGELTRASELIATGADVNHIDTAGETPIHGAAANGHVDIVAYLLSVGAGLDIPGTNAMTPLHWAAGWGNVETVRVLVEAGANVRATDALGRTARDVALKHNNAVSAEYLLNVAGA
jgi:ankyrin repeat protein